MENLNILEVIDLSASAQDLINRCATDPQYNLLCNTQENQLWSYLLVRDYPSWGKIGNPKEYYLRIAAHYGIKLRDTSDVDGIPGQKLLEQEELSSKTPLFQVQVLNHEPFTVSKLLAKTYSKAFNEVITNNEVYQVTDPAKWVFHLNEDDSNVQHLNSDWSTIVNDIFKTIFHDNVIPKSANEDVEAELIIIFGLLVCQSKLCDFVVDLVSTRLTRLTENVKKNDILYEEANLVKIEFDVAPGFVHDYLQAVSNLLYLNNEFNQEIIEYYDSLIESVPTIKLSLMPHGYPFTKRDNFDKVKRDMFIVNPLKKPKVLPDYLGSKIFADLDASNPLASVWRNNEPPLPIIDKVPTEATIRERMEIVLPNVNRAVDEIGNKFRIAFPNNEAGVIVAGGMFSLIFDDWYAKEGTHWLWKTDVDFFVYGKDHDLRVKAFDMLFDILTVIYDNNTYKYSTLKSVLTCVRKLYYDEDYNETKYNTKMPKGSKYKRKDRYLRNMGYQIINTNSKDAFEVIMNFDTSHIQIGLDSHKGWMATPYWELYYPRREALLVRYNIRGARFQKALYRGFALKINMPYALLLKANGLNYAQVIRDDKVIILIPNADAGYADDLNTSKGVKRAGKPKRWVSRTNDNDAKIETDGFGKLGKLNEGQSITEYPSSTNNRNFGLTYNLEDIRNRVKFDGQFKNGFDAYVNADYLRFSVRSQIVRGIEKIHRFLFRDVKIIHNPNKVPVPFPTIGTSKLKWSLNTKILKTSDIHNPGFYSTSDGKPFINKYGDNAEVEILRNAVVKTNELVTFAEANDNSVDNVRAGVLLPDPNIVKGNPNLPFRDNETQIQTRKLVHELYCFPVTIEGILLLEGKSRARSFKEFDDLDLHERLFSDEERSKLPRYSFDDFHRYLGGGLEITYAAIIVEFPAIVSNAIFLDEADWTMPINEVLENRELMFNCICTMEKVRYLWDMDKGVNKETYEKLTQDRQYIYKVAPTIKIFRSFSIV